MSMDQHSQICRGNAYQATNADAGQGASLHQPPQCTGRYLQLAGGLGEGEERRAVYHADAIRSDFPISYIFIIHFATQLKSR